MPDEVCRSLEEGMGGREEGKEVGRLLVGSILERGVVPEEGNAIDYIEV